MSAPERDAFLDVMLSEQIRAEVAIHNGDLTPRLSTWSQRDPVTVFGAAVPYASGWREVRPVFEWLAATFVACEDYDFEVLAADASGDLAYTVGVERYCADTSDGRVIENELRVTHVYRREDGGWRIVHRHGDHGPARQVLQGDGASTR